MIEYHNIIAVFLAVSGYKPPALNELPFLD